MESSNNAIVNEAVGVLEKCGYQDELIATLKGCANPD